VFCWELLKTHSLKGLHTLKVSTAMLKLVRLPYSAQGLVCADLRHLDCFLCYCLIVTEPSLRFLRLKNWGKGFLPLSCYFHLCVLLCIVHKGPFTQNVFLNSTDLLFHRKSTRSMCLALKKSWAVGWKNNARSRLETYLKLQTETVIHIFEPRCENKSF